MLGHEHKILENDEQKEALFNEYKGNLFEFLVCDQLANLFNVSRAFHEGLTHKLLERLKEYQETLFHYDESLYGNLFQLAHSFSKEIHPILIEKIGNEKVHTILLLGKLQATSGERLWSEADFLIETTNEKIPVSLKLSKKGAYTNTKSAGMRSFFLTYFEAFINLLPPNELVEKQNHFNHLVDNSFNQMGHKLYDENGLIFQGEFDQDWSSKFSELPGMLKEQEHLILMDHYKRISDFLTVELKYLHQLNSKVFTECLLGLMGLKDQNVWQWICFHDQHHFSSLVFEDTQNIWKKCSENEVKFIKNKESFGAIHLSLDKYQIQLRIKPMNKFTSRAYKINCSYKVSK